MYGEYANIEGKLIIDAKYMKCSDFSEDGFAAIFNEKMGQYSFINLKGQPLATEIRNLRLIVINGLGPKGFNNGLVPVNNKGKWGYLGTNGKFAIPAKYDFVTPFNCGYAIAKIENYCFVINKNGAEKQVESADIVEAKPFSEQCASFVTNSEKFGFIDTSGKVIIPAKFLEVGYFYSGMAWANENKSAFGFINKKGEWVIQPQFTVANNFDMESGLARVKIIGKWAYVNKTGEVFYMKDSEIFENFSCGLARGRKEKKIGFFNCNMKWQISPQYDDARDFKNGYAAVKSGGKWGLIDKEGTWVIQPTFDGMKDVVIVK